LRELYATTRSDAAALAELLELQFQAQRRDRETRFPGSAHELILLDGRPIGRLWVAWLPDECRLVDLAILPAHRGRGIGTRIAGEILAEADRKEVPVRLSADRGNGPALAFWARLGFAQVGGDAVYLAFERPVSRAPRPQASG
jgi:ribosomal protein S18 acetylase RimI-like enzyme